MNRHDDALGPAFASWLDEQAHAPVPPERRERALAAIATRRPRPEPVAGLGSHWISEPSRVTKLLARRGLATPDLRPLAAILLLAIAIALIGAAMVVGSRQPRPLLQLQPPSATGRLVYELAGDVYLAQADGSNPVLVGDGDLAPGSWARDARHFLYLKPAAYGSIATISDPDGQVVGSFENLAGMNGYPVWSPDSTRLQAWTDNFTQISVYRLDGSLQSELALPEGYTRFRERLGMWAPDGRSVSVAIVRGETFPCTSGAGDPTGDPAIPPCAVAELWELPVDGSPAHRHADRLGGPGFELSYAPDGTQVAFTGRESVPDDRRLMVADADGNDARPVIREDDAVVGAGEGVSPVWSPSGAQIAYVANGGAETFDLKVVDVATGKARTLLAGFAGWPPFGWSSDGERILVEVNGGPGPDGLWTVPLDGGDATVLIAGAEAGDWQPVPSGR